MALRKKPAEAAPPQARGARGGNSRPASASPADKPGAKARLAQIRAVYRITRQRDPRLPWLMLAAFVIPVAILVLLGVFVGPLWLWAPLAVLLGLLIALNVFSRRVQRTAYAEMEGKPGAAAGIIERMRGDWRLTPAVGVNRNQDVVHRVVCRAGVVIIAEGRGRGPRELLGNEVRRIRKVAGDVPIIDIVIGNGEGEVPLARLQSTLLRQRRVLRRRQVDALHKRLRAVTGSTLPIPKGPIPRNIPRGGRIR
ncbi:MAG: DUF4191 domain-containing protein [Frankia sp.]|nr:DUF4191 domain-containing protein [Frankia sp.]